jgi:hypothetical protein
VCLSERYLLDWDQYGGGRSEQVQITDAATGTVLSTQSVSSFRGGEYLVWNVTGDVNVTFTNLNGQSNAVLNGLFLDSPGSAPPPPPPATATFVGPDTTTQGNWQTVYGGQGYDVVDDASSLPSYAKVSVGSSGNYQWPNAGGDARALEEVGGGRIAAALFSPTSFTVNVNLTDGQTHQLALYLLDWDQYGGGRSEQVQITDAATGMVLRTQTISNFSNGEYLVWDIAGDINVKILNQNASSNAVLNGIFLDAVATGS